MNGTGWSRGLEVTGGGTGIVSHAGLALLRQLSDRTGLTAGLSSALPSPLGGHDRGRVLSDLACAIACGARVISDFRVMGDQRELFGPVASVPTAWRALKETAAGGDRGRRMVTAAVSKARRHAWAYGIARHGELPPVRVADGKLEGVTCIRLDATVVTAHSDGVAEIPFDPRQGGVADPVHADALGADPRQGPADAGPQAVIAAGGDRPPVRGSAAAARRAGRAAPGRAPTSRAIKVGETGCQRTVSPFSRSRIRH